MTATSGDLRRYRENYLKEQDGIALYRALARAEKDSARADIFEKLAAAEERHAVRWARLMESGGAEVPKYKPGWRVLLLAWLSRSVGTQHVLPVVSGLESRDQAEYTGQAEATGLPAAERAHSRTLRVMEQRGGGGGGARSILKSERWHRTSYGSSLHAAVFGANDGLISNFSLVMGVTGANAEPRFVLLAGVAGLLAARSPWQPANTSRSARSASSTNNSLSWKRRNWSRRPKRSRKNSRSSTRLKVFPQARPRNSPRRFSPIRKQPSIHWPARNWDWILRR